MDGQGLFAVGNPALGLPQPNTSYPQAAQSIALAALVADVTIEGERMLVQFHGVLQIPLITVYLGEVVQRIGLGLPVTAQSGALQILLKERYNFGEIGPMGPTQSPPAGAHQARVGEAALQL